MVSELTDSEFRCLVTLWAWVARYGQAGEVRMGWIDGFRFHRRRRLTPRMLARFEERGLVERYIYDDEGEQTLQIADWVEYGPVDSTSAERKRRHRRKRYGDAYYGTTGDVMAVVPPSTESAAEIEPEGRGFSAEPARTWELESLSASSSSAARASAQDQRA